MRTNVSYFVTTNFEFGCIEVGILVRWSLDPTELTFVCSNRVVDIEWQLDYHDQLLRTEEDGSQGLTLQDFVPFVPIHLGVEGKEWSRVLLYSSYSVMIIRDSEFLCLRLAYLRTHPEKSIRRRSMDEEGCKMLHTYGDTNCALSILDLRLHSSSEGSLSNDTETGELKGCRLF